MKKVLTVLLVLALAITTVSSANIKVGAEVGFGIDNIKYNYKKGGSTASEKKVSLVNKGISANLTGEYGFNDNLGVKLSAGVMYGFKAKEDPAKEEGETGELKNSGIFFDVLVDAKYSFNISEKLSVSGLGGVEVLYGNLKKSSTGMDKDNKNTNLALGVNAGLEVGYKLIDNLSINGGVSASWMFVNTGKWKKSMTPDSNQQGDKFAIKSNLYIRPYVGAQYAF